MPEGPEIFLAAREVHDAVAGQKIDVRFLYAKSQPTDLQWPKRVRIKRVYARSKAMLTEFDHGAVLYSHNQLYGQWVVHKKSEPLLAKQVRLVFETDQARVVLYSATDFMWLVRGQENRHPYIAKLGPDVLDASVTALEIANRLSAFPKRVVADALLSQQVVAGLGNYLRADILFVAKVNPLLKIGALSKKQLQRVAHAAKRLTQRSVKNNGVIRPVTQYRQAIRQGLDFEQARFFTFDREGSPCWVCRSTIIRAEQGGRGLFYCPTCQA
jgi:endonuclease VIII